MNFSGRRLVPKGFSEKPLKRLDIPEFSGLVDSILTAFNFSELKHTLSLSPVHLDGDMGMRENVTNLILSAKDSGRLPEVLSALANARPLRSDLHNLFEKQTGAIIPLKAPELWQLSVNLNYYMPSTSARELIQKIETMGIRDFANCEYDALFQSLLNFFQSNNSFSMPLQLNKAFINYNKDGFFPASDSGATIPDVLQTFFRLGDKGNLVQLIRYVDWQSANRDKK